MRTAPILFVTFNRPDLTRAVFDEIRRAKPAKLYVASDGPRDGVAGEKKLVEASRAIATSVDWECEVFTLFRDENLGLPLGYCGAMSWFFDHEDEGIILEDDTLPDQSFFVYCTCLLERYRNDNRVMNICGFNVCQDVAIQDDSYFFSHLGHAWGWATWKRAWQFYNFELEGWNTISNYGVAPSHPLNYFRQGFSKVADGTSNSCLLRWYYAVAIQNGLHVIPKKSLIKNIGIGEEATNFKSADIAYESVEQHELAFPLTHPKAVFSNWQFDAFRQRKKSLRESLAFYWHRVTSKLSLGLRTNR